MNVNDITMNLIISGGDSLLVPHFSFPIVEFFLQWGTYYPLNSFYRASLSLLCNLLYSLQSFYHRASMVNGEFL